MEISLPHSEKSVKGKSGVRSSGGFGVCQLVSVSGSYPERFPTLRTAVGETVANAVNICVTPETRWQAGDTRSSPRPGPGFDSGLYTVLWPGVVAHSGSRGRRISELKDSLHRNPVSRKPKQLTATIYDDRMQETRLHSMSSRLPRHTASGDSG